MKFFNIGGPCIPEDHYMLPATQRLEEFNIPRLLQQKSYFVVHAPRQTGKTTAMLALARELSASSDYISALLSMEVGAPFEDDPRKAEIAIIDDWKDALRFQLPPESYPAAWQPNPESTTFIGSFLADWAFSAPLPLVLFLDEIDALQDEALISVLRQLRSGYYRRPQGFPSSLALIGLRDVRDSKVKSGGSEQLNTPSPFNIAVRSVTLRNFTAPEVAQLLLQHTTETGQPFPQETIDLVFELTQGQPWLVNALAKLCVEEIEEDLSKPILPQHVLQAKETLILRRQTHLGSLAERLREPRVRQMIEPNYNAETTLDEALSPATADWLEEELADTLDEDYELELSEPALSLELRRIYKEKHPPSLARKDYFQALLTLQAELIKLQDWVQATGEKIVVLFEGRDSAGKGGVIKRITQRLNPRVCRVVALAKPSDRERTQWYFQRYVPHLPAGGEIALFDRSWYNRAGVERVMGFATPDQVEQFFQDVPEFERMLVRSGIRLIKYWFSITDEEQQLRFLMRIHDPLKQWKLSPMDLQSRVRWEEYTKAKEEMFARTNIPEAPWYIVQGNDKKRARLNCIHHLLDQIPYAPVESETIALPERVYHQDYERKVLPEDLYVPARY